MGLPGWSFSSMKKKKHFLCFTWHHTAFLLSKVLFKQHQTHTMNVVKEIDRINKRELDLGVGTKGSWHDKYKDNPFIYVGGLDYRLTEGDVICFTSQCAIIFFLRFYRCLSKT
jgi:hypothetical protein